jgi:hypothetical protein
MITRLAWATGSDRGSKWRARSAPGTSGRPSEGQLIYLQLFGLARDTLPLGVQGADRHGRSAGGTTKRSNRCPFGGTGTDAMRRSGMAKPPWGRTTEGGTAAAAQVRAAATNQREATVTGDGRGRMWRTSTQNN